MKKLFLMLLAIPFMFGFTWHTANQKTIGWDAVAKVKAGDNYVYIVYQKDESGANEGSVAVVPFGTNTYTITLTNEGSYYVGVAVERTVDTNDDGTIDDLDKDAEGNFTVLTSDINWSDVNGVNTPNPFGLKYFVAPEVPVNLHVQ